MKSLLGQHYKHLLHKNKSQYTAQLLTSAPYGYNHGLEIIPYDNISLLKKNRKL